MYLSINFYIDLWFESCRKGGLKQNPLVRENVVQFSARESAREGGINSLLKSDNLFLGYFFPLETPRCFNSGRS